MFPLQVRGGVSLDREAGLRVHRTHVRAVLRNAQWDVSVLERVRKCGRVTIGPSGHSLLRQDPASRIAHWAGLALCGSIHACPVCAAKIRYQRQLETGGAVGRFVAQGGYAELMSLTMPHDYGDQLKSTLAVVRNGWRFVLQGKQWLAVKKSARVVGYIRSVEVTHGEHGWHPHIHAVVLFEAEPALAVLEQVHAHIGTKWRTYVVRSGFRIPSDEHGVDFRPVTAGKDAGKEVGEYVAKLQERDLGAELARADMKSGRGSGRMPFEILEDFVLTGDMDDLRLWNEWERASKGLQVITWSNGLKKRLAVEEITDEEITEREVGGEDLLILEQGEWRKVTKVPGLDAETLFAAEFGGVPAVKELLARFGIEARLPTRPGEILSG